MSEQLVEFFSREPESIHIRGIYHENNRMTMRAEHEPGAPPVFLARIVPHPPIHASSSFAPRRRTASHRELHKLVAARRRRVELVDPMFSGPFLEVASHGGHAA